MEQKGKLIVIMGTNASGKSGLGIRLAKKLGGEVVSADSRQVYTGLDLGTGKVTRLETGEVPHHLLDVARPDESFSLADYQRLAYRSIDDILQRGKTPLLVGGTGLYIDAVVKGYALAAAPPDSALRRQLEQEGVQTLYARLQREAPAVAETLHPNDKVRIVRALEKLAYNEDPLAQRVSEPRYDCLLLGVTWPREQLHQRIDQRLARRLKDGMVAEVEGLRQQGVTDQRMEELGLEYRFISRYLRGLYSSYEEFYEELFRAIRQFAKRQMTWFRRYDDALWLDAQGDMLAQASQAVDEFLRS